MDENTRELVNQLKDGTVIFSDGQIMEIIEEARDEAIAEAKAIIKGMMVQAILEHALDELEGAGGKAVPGLKTVPPALATEVAPAKETPLAAAQGRTGTMETEEQIRQEIEAIRRRIGENERFLGQAKSSPVEAEDVQEPLVNDEGGASSQPSEDGYGYYVYGIVDGDGSQPAQGLPEEGIAPPYLVYTVPYQAIQAIVSRVPLREFGQEKLEANLNDMKWLEAKVRAHQGVLETVLASHALIPMRFCTIYESESRVQEMLGQRHDVLLKALVGLEGKKEWGVKIYCDGELTAQNVGEVSTTLEALKTDIANMSSGAAYFSRKKLERTIAEEVERVCDECAQRSHDRLSGQAEEAVSNPLQSRETTGQREEMILNGAYLVAEEQLAAFRGELESLGAEYGDLGFGYELTGPWPPYNFVTTGFGEAVARD